MKSLRPTALLATALGFTLLHSALGAVAPDTIPRFKARARVLTSGGAPATGAYSFVILRTTNSVRTRGEAWSDWMTFDRAAAAATVGPHSYPNNYMRSWPVVSGLSVGGIADPARVEAEVVFEEPSDPVSLPAELFGSHWGWLLSRSAEGRPLVATVAQYNRRYWAALGETPLSAEERPHRIPIVDRFIAGDQDWNTLREGIHRLSGAGFSAMMLGPDARSRQILLETGLRRTGWAVYNPPGYAFDHAPSITPEAVTAWAQKEAAPFLKAGYAPEDMAIYAMSDEPGWYYPSAFTALTNNPVALARFRAYLRDQGLKPRDLGAARWEAVFPLSYAPDLTLPQRRLFYWTARFFPWDSARHFAASTRALEAAFYTNLPIFVNWNFFSGRSYVPGPVAHNPDKKHPGAAMGGHDWFEFGRMRGCTMLWTEDWFGDDLAYNWSYHSARMRSAARLGGVEFGGYVVPRTAGGRPDGLAQKIAAILGQGGKGIKYFVFGPEYTFPGNCYSEKLGLLGQMAEAHRLVGRAESLLWPGRPLPNTAALLMPRSAFFWDARGISDATNVRLNNQTVDYLAEVYNLYLAAMHANLPLDFVEEDQLTRAGLAGIRVLYITEPNIPAEFQKELVAWVKQGGILVSVSGAGRRDRYNDPCPILRRGLGLTDGDRDRIPVPHLGALPVVNAVSHTGGVFDAIGAWDSFKSTRGLEVLARFTNEAPAVVATPVGKGRAIHFAFLPGLAYARSPAHPDAQGQYSQAARDLILAPLHEAGIHPRVRPDRPLVEAPLLVSDAGAVVTLLNWTGADIDPLTVTLDWDRPVQSVESAQKAPLKFATQNGQLTFSLPVRGVDFILIRSPLSGSNNGD